MTLHFSLFFACDKRGTFSLRRHEFFLVDPLFKASLGPLFLGQLASAARVQVLCRHDASLLLIKPSFKFRRVLPAVVLRVDPSVFFPYVVDVSPHLLSPGAKPSLQ